MDREEAANALLLYERPLPELLNQLSAFPLHFPFELVALDSKHLNPAPVGQKLPSVSLPESAR
jgi:hypothetical protein